MRVHCPGPWLPSVLLVFSLSAGAQAPKVAATSSATDPAAQYAAEPVVIVRLATVTSMNADGTGTTERTGVVRVQSDAMLKQFSVLSLPFAGGSQKVQFTYARVRHPDGSTVDTPPSDMIEQPAPVTREAPFYSDLKAAQLPIKGLRVGDTLQWQSRATGFKAEIPGQFWGQESFVPDALTLDETYELRVPATAHVNVWTNPRAGARVTEATEGQTHIYRWAHSNLKPTVGPAAEAAKEADKKKALTPDEELDTKDGKLPDIAWTTFPDWQSVGAWYRDLEADRTEPSPAIRAKVAELTAGKDTQEEKVQAVYAYVATQIHYIGVAFGIGRYQPHTADEVLSSQYGDCKDKHTLLASMLTALGLQPDAVLIGSEVRFNQAVPAPQSFNHLITHVELDGKPVWLDSTTEVAPYRVLVATLRDKPALVIPSQGPASIQRTPAELPFPSFENMTAKGSLDENGISDSHITLTYRGDVELFLREVIRQITAAQYDELAQRLINSMGYAGTTSHAEVTRPDDTSQPFTISFDYHREKPGDWDNRRILAQLAPPGLPLLDPKDPPRQAVDLRFPRVQQSHAEMKLPDGWGVELPEAVHTSSPYATDDTTFHFEKGLLIADRKITILKQQVPVSDWQVYKKWQDATDLGDEPYIQLTTTPAKANASKDATDNTAAAATASKTPGADLLEQANHSLQLHRLEAAEEALDKAKQINSNLRGLWNGYGYLAFSRGNTEEAMADYRKELDQHPGDAWAYQHLASLQIATNKHAEAADTLRTWMAAAPNDARPVMLMINMLVDEGKPVEAAAAGKSGLAHLEPENTELETVEVALARAQLKAGALKDADATLKPLLNSPRALILNDAAYELADANLEIPAAEAAQRTALGKLDAETAAWTLDEAPQTLSQTSALLAATWDTMGWILFREGKTAEALPYLRPARRNHRDYTVAEHLGDAELALGNKPAALAAYQDALNIIPRVDSFGVRKDAGPPARTLQGKIDKLKQAGIKPAPFVEPESQQGRTFSLGPSKGRNGMAEYRLLLSREKIERIEAVAGSDQIHDPDAVLQAFPTNAFFPPASGARLVKTGFLNCHQSVCELVLRP